MGFYLEKIVWVLLSPTNLMLLAVVLAALLLWIKRINLARWVLSAVVVFLLLLSILPLGQISLEKLEDWVEQAPINNVDGIIVLGGAENPFTSYFRKQITLNGAAERLIESARLAKKYPGAKVLFLGGSGSIVAQQYKEADTAKQFFLDSGISETRIFLDDRPRNTYESALLGLKVGQSASEENWVLVTSAYHMLRAIAVFKTVGWYVRPYKVDYVTPMATGLLNNPWDELLYLQKVIHEFLGICYYVLRGRIGIDYLLSDKGF